MVHPSAVSRGLCHMNHRPALQTHTPVLVLFSQGSENKAPPLSSLIVMFLVHGGFCPSRQHPRMLSLDPFLFMGLP